MKNRKWVFKSLFVLGLVCLGLSLEHLIYQKGSRKLTQESSMDKKKVLFLGGSIARNLDSGVWSALVKRGWNDHYELKNFVMPFMSTKEVIKSFPQILSTFRPDVIFLMIGFDDQRVLAEQSAQQIADKVELSLQDGTDKAKFTDHFIGAIKEALKRKDHRYLYDLNLYLMIQLESFIRKIEVQKLTRFFEDTLKNSAAEGPKCIEEIIAMGIALKFMTGEVLGMSAQDMRKSAAVQKKIREDFRSNLRTLMVEGSARLEKMGRDMFLKQENFFSIFDRAFITHTWPGNKIAGTDPYQFYFSHPDKLRGYEYIFILLSREPSDRGRLSMEGKFIEETNSKRRVRQGVVQESDDTGAGLRTFYERIAQIKKMTNDSGAKLVLLQYPNSDRIFLQEASSRSGIRLIDGKAPFKDLIDKDNYFRFFSDVIEDTGHLTALGAQVFGEHIVSSSPEIFSAPSSNL